MANLNEAAKFSLKMRNGGLALRYDPPSRTIQLGDDVLPVDDWHSLRNHVERVLIRGGAYPPRPPVKVNQFLNRNMEDLVKVKRGRVQRAPWWLRWAFDSVITKEEYVGQD